MSGPRAALATRGERWLAHGFGSGLAPVAPGTFGSAAAVLPLLLLPETRLPWAIVAGAVIATLASALLCRRLRGKKDPGWFVLDEFAGQWLASCLVAPYGWKALLASFVLFRVFDITKPWPARRLERVGGGFGIVLDDLAAGLYALAITLALIHWTHLLGEF